MDELLVNITSWLEAGSIIAFPASFLWGMVSVLLSPCHLASIPLFIAYVAGQKKILSPRQAARYAVLFATGIFFTIMVVGIVCALIGRMLGDIGTWWQVAVGVLLLWVAWTLFLPSKCSTTGSIINRLKIQGHRGALILGLAYGLLSGVCTFGFIAPILGIITLHNQIFAGIVMLIFFGIGHCLPLVFCGMFSARTMEILHARHSQNALIVLRKLASIVLAVLGLYFIFVSS